MKRILVALLLVPTVAIADPHHVLVLRSEGNGDAALKSRIDAAVLKLAKNLEGNVEAGDITLSDAAAATGCSIAEPACKDEVLTTLGVDEIVAATVTAAPVETKVVVRRLTKGGAGQSAASTIASNQPIDAKLATDVGAMFGVKAASSPPPTPPPTPPNNTTTTTTTNPPTPPPVRDATPTRTADATDTVTAAPNNTIPPAEPHEGNSRKLELAGMVGGGVLMIVGIAFWAQASSTQDSINNAPTKTVTDFRNLQNLESNADAYALGGNLAFFTGVALGAVSGYFFWRDHRRGEHRTARLSPAVMGRGAGVTLTIGGPR